jgi:hypothetical protein
MERYAVSTWRANRGASVSGEARIRPQRGAQFREAREISSQGHREAHVIVLGRGGKFSEPNAREKTQASRETGIFPGNVSNGAPIHRTSQVVVIPLKGKGSSPTSIRW